MKKVLVVYYTQTGQLEEIVESVTAPMKEDQAVEVTYERVYPAETYPFPWKAIDFFDAFPESVQGVGCELQPFQFDPQENFDLIILGYQPWYLSPSIPTSSFLQSEAAKQVMKGKPVITVIGSRNMWVNAQEQMKRSISDNGGELIGNISLVDRHSNFVSLITILGWMLKGKREGFLGFPRSGVSPEDVEHASVYGEEILRHLKTDIRNLDQQKLRELGAVEINPNLLLLENRGIKAFRAFSNFIRRKGGPGASERKFRLRLFASCLFPVIAILSPLTTLSVYLIRLLKRKKIKEEVEYYSGVGMKP